MGQNFSQDVRATQDEEPVTSQSNKQQSILSLTKEEEIELHEEFKKFQEQLRQKDIQSTELQNELRTKEQDLITIKDRLLEFQRQVEVLIEGKQSQVMELQSQLRTNEQEIITMREREKRAGLLMEAEQWRVRELQSQLETNGQEMRAAREQLRGTQQREINLNRILADYQCKNPPDWVINRNEIYISDQVLGIGAWGKVFRGKVHGCVVAVKKMHETIMSDYNRRVFEREANIASKCRHPCMLLLIGATIDDETPLLVTEIMDCSLREVLHSKDEPPLSTAEVSIISQDVARALNYLHKKREPVVHCDVNSGNVLLWRQGNQWRAKVSDYGTANFLHQSTECRSSPGNPVYCAPEFLCENPHRPISCKVDVYSFGVLLCEIYAKEAPDPQGREKQIAKIGNPKFQNLVRRCVEKEPWERPNMESVIEELERPEVDKSGVIRRHMAPVYAGTGAAPAGYDKVVTRKYESEVDEIRLSRRYGTEATRNYETGVTPRKKTEMTRSYSAGVTPRKSTATFGSYGAGVTPRNGTAAFGSYGAGVTPKTGTATFRIYEAGVTPRNGTAGSLSYLAGNRRSQKK